jgi:FAD/FMN-containing dehydrogenase
MTSTVVTSVEDLRTAVSGQVIVAGDAGYEQARKVWNGMVDRHPAVILRVSDAADVAAGLAFARAAGLEVSVRGGGHNFSGAAVCEGGVVVDLGLLRSVEVDPDARTARAGGGATNADLDAATQAHGLGVPAGTVSDTGIGGLTLGGGFGWLTARHGLSIDNLIAAEVVLADGQIVRASADTHPDLFWALRGGGGNFGVVTEFTYRLHPVGPVDVGMFFWAESEGLPALQSARRMLGELPPGAGAIIAAMSAPPAPFVPAELHGTPCYVLMVTDFAAEGALAGFAERLRAVRAPLIELVTPMPYVQLQKLLDGGGYPGVFAYEKSIYLKELTDEVLQAVARNAPRRSQPMSFTLIFPLSGGYCATADDATAFGGVREPGYVVSVQATCAAAVEMDRERDWVRSFWSDLARHATDVGGYVNFMAEYDSDRVRATYGRKYERLSRIKGRYDPENVFRHNANITPTASS